MGNKEFYIGELAEKTRVSKSAINYYDKYGLLHDPKRDENNYRLFKEDDLKRLLFIKKAKRYDFSLREIKLILSKYESGGNTCDQISEHLRKRRLSLEYRIKTLNEDLSKIKELENEIDKLTI